MPNQVSEAFRRSPDGQDEVGSCRGLGFAAEIGTGSGSKDPRGSSDAVVLTAKGSKASETPLSAPDSRPQNLTVLSAASTKPQAGPATFPQQAATLQRCSAGHCPKQCFALSRCDE